MNPHTTSPFTDRLNTHIPAEHLPAGRRSRDDQVNATDNVIAYADTQYGELLCADHGAERDALIAANPENGDEDRLFPTMTWESIDGAVIEWCGAGHSFCMSCGTDLDTIKGSQDADVNGHFGRCHNCGTESVYVDGIGYSFANSWTDVLDTHKVQVYGITATYQTDLNGYTTVTTVLDEHAGPMRTLCAYAGFMPSDPSAGVVLVLGTDVDEATDVATEHFIGADADANSGDGDAVRYVTDDVVLVQVPTDQVWFATKG